MDQNQKTQKHLQTWECENCLDTGWIEDLQSAAFWNFDPCSECNKEEM